MDDLREKVIRGLEWILQDDKFGFGENWDSGEPQCDEEKAGKIIWDTLAMLKSQEPHVMTLEEVIEHYSSPPVLYDDLRMEVDYYEDIQPLYFEFLHQDDPLIVHWRRYEQAEKYIRFEPWRSDYGKTLRCWCSRPTNKQRKAEKWDE